MPYVRRYQTGSGERWRVDFYAEFGEKRSRSFRSREEARRFAALQELAASENRRQEFDRDAGDSRARPAKDLAEMFFNDWVLAELARSTQGTYACTYNRWIAPYLAEAPLYELENASAPAGWMRAMERDGAGPQARAKAICVLSSMLSYGVEQGILRSNGLIAARTPRRRRKRMWAGAPIDRKPGRVLSPLGAELIRAELLNAPGRDPLLRRRDATMVSLLYLAGLRPQEAIALAWIDLSDESIRIWRVVSGRELEAPKTRGSSRVVPLLPILSPDLADWLEVSAPHDLGSPIFRGNGSEGQMSESDFRNWREDHWKPASARAGAVHAELGHLASATPYSCRRGYITMRLRAGDGLEQIAEDAGTSIQMIVRNYAGVIAELRRKRPKPFEVELRRAREQAAEYRAGNFVSEDAGSDAVAELPTLGALRRLLRDSNGLQRDADGHRS